MKFQASIREVENGFVVTVFPPPPTLDGRMIGDSTEHVAYSVDALADLVAELAESAKQTLSGGQK